MFPKYYSGLQTPMVHPKLIQMLTKNLLKRKTSISGVSSIKAKPTHSWDEEFAMSLHLIQFP